jgi:hypothetical protein
MSLPRLIPVPSLGFNLPSLPSYQEWAINADTNSLVLIEFPYLKDTNLTTQNTDSQNLLNTTLEQNSSLINNQLQALENRITNLEILINNSTNIVSN